MYRKFGQYWDLIAAENFEVSRAYLSYVKRNKRRISSILELGCGTGFNLRKIEQIGKFELTGIDLSSAMLRIGARSTSKVNFVRSNMVTFRTKRRFDLIFSANDSINHLLRLKDWGRLFKNVAAHLAPRGVFLFDVVTPRFFNSFSRENGYFWTFPGCFLHFSLAKRARTFRWNVRIFKKKVSNIYHYLTDQSDQIAVSQSRIYALLRESGFRNIEKFVDEESPNFSKCDRIYFKCVL